VKGSRIPTRVRRLRGPGAIPKPHFHAVSLRDGRPVLARWRIHLEGGRGGGGLGGVEEWDSGGGEGGCTWKRA